ncbi:MAG: nuclease-related domain-containing protein [Pseudomonadota bacterium]
MTSLVLLLEMMALILGPVFLLAGIVLTWRYWDKRRRKTRSPLSEDLLRAPGESLWHQFRKTDDKLNEAFMFVFLLPALFIGFWGYQSASGLSTQPWLYVLVTLIIVFWAARRLMKLTKERDKLRLGYDAERAVAQNLNELLRDGYSVFHDLPTDTGNIDHVVVGPNGVFAVETKGRSKTPRGQGKEAVKVAVTTTELRFPHGVETQPIEQAKRQAKWLSKWLTSATGMSVEAAPALALPGWFVEHKERPSMLVFNGKNPRTLFAKVGNQRLGEQEITQICHQLRQHCSSVERL